MISVDFPNHRFQLRAAAVAVDDDFVLLHRAEGDTVWALPGGRVAPGESAHAKSVLDAVDLRPVGLLKALCRPAYSFEHIVQNDPPAFPKN